MHDHGGHGHSHGHGSHGHAHSHGSGANTPATTLNEPDAESGKGHAIPMVRLSSAVSVDDCLSGMETASLMYLHLSTRNMNMRLVSFPKAQAMISVC